MFLNKVSTKSLGINALPLVTLPNLYLMRNEVRGAKPNKNALANPLKLSEILQDSRTDKFAMQLFPCEHLDIDEDRNISYLSNTIDFSTPFKQFNIYQNVKRVY